MTLESFKTFMETPQARMHGPRVWTNGFSWSIMVVRREPEKQFKAPRFGFYVKCYGDGESKNWAVKTRAVLKILKNGAESNAVIRTFTTLYSREATMRYGSLWIQDLIPGNFTRFR